MPGRGCPTDATYEMKAVRHSCCEEDQTGHRHILKSIVFWNIRWNASESGCFCVSCISLVLMHCGLSDLEDVRLVEKQELFLIQQYMTDFCQNFGILQSVFFRQLEVCRDES